MEKKARTSVAVIASIVMIAVIALLVVLNIKFGGVPDALDEASSTNPETVTSEESASQGVTEEPSQPTTSDSSEESEESEESETETETDEDQTHSAADNYGNPNVQTISIDEDQWYLTLVNRDRKLPEDFKPTTSYLIDGNSAELDSRCADDYIAMYNAALEDGCTLTPYSGYRRISTQKRNYENKIAQYQSQGYSYLEAAEEAATRILPPGTSEHNLGLAMDIVCASSSAGFEDTKEFAWLMENAQDYGFILRYPEDKQDITKIIYEPWHWRYVGVEAAKAMKASGQCLEEYLGYA